MAKNKSRFLGIRDTVPNCQFASIETRGKRLHSDQPQSWKLNKDRKPSCWCVVSFWVLRLLHNTPQKLNIAPEQLPSPQKTYTLPTIFRGLQFLWGVQAGGEVYQMCLPSMISQPNSIKYMSTWQRVWSIMSNQLLTISTPTWQWSDTVAAGRRLRMSRIKSQWCYHQSIACLYRNVNGICICDTCIYGDVYLSTCTSWTVKHNICLKNTQHLLDKDRWSTGIPEYGTVHTPGGLLWEDGGTPVYIYQNNGCVDCSGMLLKWHWGVFLHTSFVLHWKFWRLCCYIFLHICSYFFTCFTNNDFKFAALPPSGTSSGNIHRHSDVWAGAAEVRHSETWQSVR